jgi:hypothetical protein
MYKVARRIVFRVRNLKTDQKSEGYRIRTDEGKGLGSFHALCRPIFLFHVLQHPPQIVQTLRQRRVRKYAVPERRPLQTSLNFKEG